ncbi:unnamed protein product [Kuraishia capsulata CBS 1993]|uniref:DNA-directed RNA polymerase III subunit RPC5 n=1 Tax=Kuraishia capsulata CBS 1993 TaxID=1382522 RepID=W6MQ78_9ASCO|nr:uncharacterized protein KUCA_T00004826001 [Kuraishia capsulata CBS 1993]CDK28841.1 unnamed protein product [Kuraishia capsulata CBS 1993]
MSLFVSDDEIDEPMEGVTGSMDGGYIDDLDDPVVEEIPISFKPISEAELYLLQFPNKAANSAYAKHEIANISDAKVKSQSGIIEVEIPVDKSRFFDQEKSEKWFNVEAQTLSGVSSDAQGYCAGQLVNGELCLFPLAKTMQLRPSFKYVDALRAFRNESARATDLHHGPDARDKKKDVQVVQMSMKTVGDNAPRLGGALQSKKREEEERYESYEFRAQHDEASVSVLKSLRQMSDSELRLETRADNLGGLLE